MAKKGGRWGDKGTKGDYISTYQIKDITLCGQRLLLHAKRKFPKYISTILWPFAIKCYEDKLNNLVHRADGHTPYETLASLDAAPINTSNFHTFGCPCYVLDLDYSQVLERFPNGKFGCGWVFMLVVCLLMHPMLD
jgi:hypothetical protein